MTIKYTAKVWIIDDIPAGLIVESEKYINSVCKHTESMHNTVDCIMDYSKGCITLESHNFLHFSESLEYLKKYITSQRLFFRMLENTCVDKIEGFSVYMLTNEYKHNVIRIGEDYFYQLFHHGTLVKLIQVNFFKHDDSIREIINYLENRFWYLDSAE